MVVNLFFFFVGGASLNDVINVGRCIRVTSFVGGVVAPNPFYLLNVLQNYDVTIIKKILNFYSVLRISSFEQMFISKNLLFAN